MFWGLWDGGFVESGIRCLGLVLGVGRLVKDALTITVQWEMVGDVGNMWYFEEMIY